MRRPLFGLIIMLLVVSAAVIVYQRRASAFTCNFAITGACGYFTDTPGFSDFNVLPGTALSTVPTTAGAAQFISLMNGYLFGADPHGVIGAAFIVDNMLAYKGTVGVPVGGGSSIAGPGVQFARNNWASWVTLVNFYANSTSPSVYGIDWNYIPSQALFCTPGHPNSGYDATQQDAEIYQMSGLGSPSCGLTYFESIPEIQFYWANHTASFEIGKACGNLQNSLTPFPPINRAPTGTLTVTCNPANGQQTAVATFSDADAPTTATLTTGTSPNNLSVSLLTSPKTIAIPISDTSPYVAQPVNLIINDKGPTAAPGATVTITKNTAVPCVTLGCGSLSISPVVIDPYMSYSLTVSVTNNVSSPPPGNFTITVTSPAPAAVVFTGTKAATGSGGTSTATFTGIPPVNNSARGAGVYSVSWTFTGGGGMTCPGTFPVVYLPYLNVYGGDVSVGNSPSFSGGASTCVSDGASGVYSWNNHSAGFTGAGAQYAVNALAGVVDFASALSSDNTAPTGLSFANTFNPADATKLNPAAGLFGGYFGGLGSDCDFTSDISSAPTPGGITIAATTVPLSTNTVRYVSGDVYISGNITYAGTAGWASISQIPSFRLIVTGGDIYISSSVTQLDGLYVAEPNGAIGGRIFTCASAIGVPVNPQTPGSYTTCHQQLVINGAFVAKYVSFGRTFGSLGQATATDSLTSNHDAEVFNYTPELWVPRSSSPPNSGYTAITGLPPVL